MPSKTETTARRLVAEIYRATDGRPQRWCTLWEIAHQAGADTEAVHHAVEEGWVDVAPKHDPHSVTLLEAGGRLVK